MNTLTEPLTIATRYASTRYRSASYWLATVPVAAELSSRRMHSPRQEP